MKQKYIIITFITHWTPAQIKNFCAPKTGQFRHFEFYQKPRPHQKLLALIEIILALTEVVSALTEAVL